MNWLIWNNYVSTTAILMSCKPCSSTKSKIAFIVCSSGFPCAYAFTYTQVWNDFSPPCVSDGYYSGTADDAFLRVKTINNRTTGRAYSYYECVMKTGLLTRSPGGLHFLRKQLNTGFYLWGPWWECVTKLTPLTFKVMNYNLKTPDVLFPLDYWTWSCVFFRSFITRCCSEQKNVWTLLFWLSRKTEPRQTTDL